jgi:tape measure domain-containing protein
MATEKVGYELTLRDLMSKGLGDINSKLNQLEGKLKSTEAAGEKAGANMGKAFKVLGGFFALDKVRDFGKEVLYTTARFQSLGNSIKFASDTATQGESSMIWMSQMSKKYGLPLEETAEGFKTLQGALMKTKFSSGEVRKMFEQVSTGAVAMGLTADDTKGVFLALGQIMGKGKVSAEELRGQIGERVPGAFAIAARAMGKTTAELDNLMKEGKLLSEDFLPKFAAEMEKTFGTGAEQNMNSLTSSLNRLDNSWKEFTLTLGTSAEEGGAMSNTINLLSSGLDKLTGKFTTVEQKSRKLINPQLMSDLDYLNKTLTDKVSGLQKQGLAPAKIDGIIQEDLQKELARIEGLQQTTEYGLNPLIKKLMESRGSKFEDFTRGERDDYVLEQIRKYDSDNNSFTNTFGKIGFDPDKRKDPLMESIKIRFKQNRDLDTYLRSLRKGTTETYTDVIKRLYNKEGAFAAPNSVSDKLKEESSSVSGSAPKTVNIHVDALIKGTVNNIIEKAQNARGDLRDFMNQLEQSLLTVVNDVNIITE